MDKTNHVDIVTICVESYDCFSPGDLAHQHQHVHSSTFTVVPTNIGKYQVSVKHTTVTYIVVFFCIGTR